VGVLFRAVTHLEMTCLIADATSLSDESRNLSAFDGSNRPIVCLESFDTSVAISGQIVTQPELTPQPKPTSTSVLQHHRVIRQTYAQLCWRKIRIERLLVIVLSKTKRVLRVSDMALIKCP
jgi:hypothetical protein